MEWKFNTSKAKPKPGPACLVDEIEETPKLRELFSRAGIKTGHGSPAHRIVSEVIIKVFKERKLTPREIAEKYSSVPNFQEILLEIVKEASRKGELSEDLINVSTLEELEERLG
ncbi:hypothetical protein MetMK1DRAFT_00009680 [Metallosphaera yellowstonensis MK1]|uniref:Uncharacterized protein n=1 Tax=Metallosphaera yellowstonensis MK1 TaxID=671065 RepID=H2C2J4_9CREN|nr:hypothetical protein [Metallosphaera yellowstonensis]EHP70465.1 hypothetical protein MetMK1DRAFT_00009680 [Metallosphaera yellowstonensis MK1]